MFKFGDVIENGYASDNNPHKSGVFIKYSKQGIEVTDTKNNFWVIDRTNDKIIKIGSIIPEVQNAENNT